MIEMFDRPVFRMSNRPAILMRDVSMRILDISGSGCLVESRRRVEVGTVGRLRLKFGTEEYDDDVEVVRCEAAADARPVYHLGVRFLWTTPRHDASIREAVIRHQDALDPPESIWVM